MWRRRCLRIPFHWRRKHLVLLAILVGSMFVLTPWSRLYHTLVLGLHGHARTRDYARLVRRMVAPAPGDYQLENPYKVDFSRGQSKIIDNLLGGKNDGFFLDIGAGNGETNSVSLYFERERKWRGVLVEANETKHRWSIIKNRQAYMWNLRLRLGQEMPTDVDNDVTPEQLLTMINRTSVDLLSVNLNGWERELVSHIDLTKYRFRVITMELQSGDNEEKYQGVRDILTSHGYRTAHHVINSFQGKRDVIFVT